MWGPGYVLELLASECKLTEVRIRPLPLPVVFVMNSELCDFRVTKQPCVHASDVSFEIKKNNIIGNFSYFPPGVFVQHNFPYSTNQHTNFSRPFARTQYMFSSFVPSVITLWNALPNSVKPASSISVFKRLLHSM